MDRNARSRPLLEFRVLGDISATVDGTAIDFGGPRQRRLLALLLSRANSVVEVATLAEEVWDDVDRPEHTTAAIRTYVSRVRRSIDDVGVRSTEVLETRSGGYTLRLGALGSVDVQLDAARFEELTIDAAGRLDEGDVVAARARLDQALQTWGGPPYQEFADHAWAEPDVARLNELRRVATEQRAAIRLQLGEHAGVVADLERLLADDPLRARPVHLLMLALYQSGRQAEALRVAGRHRRALAAVGLEPAEDFTVLESQIATADPALRPSLERPGTLPRPISSFVGRDADLRRIGEQLAGSRLVTLTGPGGVGKTRLAVELAAGHAQRYPNGVWFTALAQVDTDDLVAPALIAGLGVDGWSGDPLTVIVRRLAGQQALIVIDNCEHVIDATSTVVKLLLERTDVTVLCTSREGFGLAEEQLCAVGPLVGEAARELFVARAGSAGAAIDPADDAVDAVCSRLDGLPLAIELAAARVRSIAPAELAEHLRDHMHLLAGRRGRIERHRTIDATIDWSYRLLEASEQRVFRRLAPFTGGFTLDAAIALAAADRSSQARSTPDELDAGDDRGDVVEAVTSLVDKSMVVVAPAEAGHRYRLLEPVRQYARRRLVERGELESTERSFVEWVERRWSELVVLLEGPDEASAVPDAIDEWDNLVSAANCAYERGETDAALRMICSSRSFALFRGRYDGVTWARSILDDIHVRPASQAASTVLYIRAVHAVALSCCIRGEWDLASAYLDRADEVPGARQSSSSLQTRATIEGNGRGNIDRSLELYREALQRGHSPANEAVQRANLGSLVARRDPVEYRANVDRLQHLLDAHPMAPSKRALCLVRLALPLTDADAVRNLAHQAESLARQSQATWPAGLARGELLRIAILHDPPQDALELLVGMLPAVHANGQMLDAYTVLWRAARLLTRVGSHRDAVLLDDVVLLTGSRQMLIQDPAFAALEPQRDRFGEVQLAEIRAEATHLLGDDAESLQPVTNWLATRVRAASGGSTRAHTSPRGCSPSSP